MKHKFSSKDAPKLRSEKRKKILPPDETLNKLNLQKGDIMADIGCGIGFFTFPAAKIVGDNGKVYALDISSEMLDEVKREINEDNINNVETIQVDEYDLKLSDEIITYAFISTVLHEIENLDLYLKEIKRILKRNGKIVIIEWEKKKTLHGPPENERLGKKELIEQLKNIGFDNFKDLTIGTDFYTLTGEKLI